MAQERILVVEDHAATARGLKVYLEVCGFAVALADSIQSALRVTRTTDFDVLICDLNLPDGTGWDLMKRLSKKKAVRAIAFSAYDEPDHVKRSQAVGFCEHVVKGSSPESLLAAIRRALPPGRQERKEREP